MSTDDESSKPVVDHDEIVGLAGIRDKYLKAKEADEREEMDRFYMHPDADVLARHMLDAIEMMNMWRFGIKEFPRKPHRTYCGFFGTAYESLLEVLLSRFDEFRDKCTTRTRRDFLYVVLAHVLPPQYARQFAKSPKERKHIEKALKASVGLFDLTRPFVSEEDIDFWWGCFFATGDCAFVDKQLQCLAHPNERLVECAKKNLVEMCKKHPVLSSYIARVVEPEAHGE